MLVGRHSRQALVAIGLAIIASASPVWGDEEEESDEGGGGEPSASCNWCTNTCPTHQLGISGWCAEQECSDGGNGSSCYSTMWGCQGVSGTWYTKRIYCPRKGEN